MTKDANHVAGFTDWHERAAAWRRRAEQLQMIANELPDAQARNALSRQSRQWARMAEEAEILAQEWQRKVPDAAQKH